MRIMGGSSRTEMAGDVRDMDHSSRPVNRAYSALSASVGLTDTARWAGNHPASSASASSTAATPTNTIGSVADVLNSSGSTQCRAPNAMIRPSPNADRRKHAPATYDQRGDRTRTRAQRETTTNLVPPPRNGVRHDAVQSEPRDDQRERRTEAKRDHPSRSGRISPSSPCDNKRTSIV